ncbi:MAG TPA: patatin-like phospholipase family protein [Actinomycetes bacterium]|nr:patatin-like phospholipase family protein [Actinomycetes bacterium]
MRAAGFLRNVPVLAGLPDELLERLAQQAKDVRVRAGAWVMREGESADSMFIVCSGRLEVIDEGPPETLIRVLRRGDVLGELALLRAETRSASVRARRDAELVELGRAEFEALIMEAPSFALGLLRAMGERLATSRASVVAVTPPRTIAVVGLDPAAPTTEVAKTLADEASTYGSAARLAAGDLATIDRAERDAERVVLHAGSDPADQWAELCLREADLVVAVTTGMPGAEWLRRQAALQGCELIILGSAVADETRSRLRPREVQLVAQPGRLRHILEQTARRIAGRAPGLVLSGGGARAFAHLGVVAELREAGLRLDRVAGVSLGAAVAAMIATGLTSRDAYRTLERACVDANPSNDFVPPVYSLIRGSKTRRLLHETFGNRRIEELPVRFFCMSCDLVAREPVFHRAGPIAKAVYSSLAIPGVYPPVASHGRLLVDGGVLDNLPVAAMAGTGEGPVIAVDTTGRAGAPRRRQRPAVARLGRPVRRLLTGSEAEIPRLGETILRTMTVGSSDTAAAAGLHADLVITPPVEHIGLLDWKALPRVVELGRRAAREALEADPEVLSRLGS